MTRPSRGARRDARQPRVAPESVATLRIDAIAAGGDGVGRLDGRATFVPRTAPGDEIQAAVTVHGRLARGRLLQLLVPSPDRVAPACAHYEADRCGGCQLQHLSPEAQGAARTRLVREALERIGGRRIPVPALVTGAAWGYRGRITLTLVRRGARWRGGLHPYDDPVRVFELRTCPITHPGLVAAWEAVRPWLETARLPEAPALRLSLRWASSAVGEGEGGVILVLEGGRSWGGGEGWGAEVLRAVPAVRGCWWRPEGQDRAVRLAEHPGVDTASATAFAQVHAALADRLREHVVRVVQGQAPRTVVDAYAGVGRLAARLQASGIAGVAIEADDAGAAEARRVLTGDGASTAASWRVETALVEAALPGALPADVVVVNPPRRGVAPVVCETLDLAATRGTRALVYVSCDPATLARDMRRLPRWRIADVICFDLFPQTAHVETVCVLQPEGA